MLCINRQSMGLGIHHGLTMVEIVGFDSLKMTEFCSKEKADEGNLFALLLLIGSL
jgi:hypothetical protein